MSLRISLIIAAAILILMVIGWLIYAQIFRPSESQSPITYHPTTSPTIEAQNSPQPESQLSISAQATPEAMPELPKQPKQILFQLTACPPKNTSCDQPQCQSFNQTYLQNLAANLNNQQFPPDLQQQFEQHQVDVSSQLTVATVTLSQTWLITDTANQQIYFVNYPGAAEGFQVYWINDNFPNFPTGFTSQLPHDVDYDFAKALLSQAFDANKKLVDSHQLALAQRLYDIFSWQSFLAINWPVDTNGQAKASLTDPSGLPRWTIWMDSLDVFKADPGCGTSDTSRLVKTDQVSENPEGDQLWDQNGNLVYYQMLINQVEFDNILYKNLYNRAGQIQFYPQALRPTGIFDYGQPDRSGEGAIELKLAWKMIDEDQGDIPSRYFTRTLQIAVPDPDHSGQTKWVEQEMGLVGMHIAHKTLSSFTWIWSTFEHVDNVQVDNLEVGDVNGETQPLKPAFNDPNCPTCPVNVPPTPDANGVRKTQVMRLIPISEATTELNQQVQQLLKAEGSVWQYYELVGTQFPTKPYSAVADTSTLPGMLTGESAGNPMPVYLVNSVIETYLQQGNQPAKNLTRLGGTNETPAFGTSSCMGCHSGAYLPTLDKQNNTVVPGVPGSADFSWLLWRETQQDAVKSGN